MKRQEEYGFHIKLPEITELYKARLREAARKAFAGRKVTLDADDGRIKDIFEGLFSDSAPEESRVTFSGEKVSLSEDGRTLNDDELTELCILSEFDKGKSAALKYSAPCIFDELAAEYGGKTERYFECPADDGDRKARELAEDEAWERDPVIRLIVAAGYLREKKLTVADASKIIKPVKRESASVKTGGINPGRIVNDITSGDASAKAGEGKVLKVGNGYAVVRALKNGSGILVTAESDRYETAREICGELIKKVERRKKDILDS